MSIGATTSTSAAGVVFTSTTQKNQKQDVAQAKTFTSPVVNQAGSNEADRKTNSAKAAVKVDPVERWWERHGSSFVAHAVWDTNVQKVLKARKISPAEQVLRETGEVEYEEGSQFGQRFVAKLPKLSAEDVAALKAIEENYFKEEQIKEIAGEVAKLGFECIKIITVVGVQLCEVSTKIRLWLNQLSFELMKFDDSSNAFGKKFHELAQKYCSPMTSIGVAYDMTKPLDKRVDVVLSKLFNEYLAKLQESDKFVKEFVDANGIKDEICGKNVAPFLKFTNGKKLFAMTRPELFDFFMKMRRVPIPGSKLNQEIRTQFNGTAWEYGECVIYRGNTKNIIAGDDRSFDSGVELIQNGVEAFLLSPFENGGKFFELILDDPDTIILAPKKVIEQYRARGLKGYDNLHAFEDLSQTMLDRFEVPASLRPH